mmetsp:Transcript_20663/g.41707  ORF Transcript_20663/g.41707 Transcript_20663/m.41707 type:complete len:111 (-) Transcript_20663:265-597(-)
MANTALIDIACHGHLDVVRYLVEAKATVDARGEGGKTALEWAREKNKRDVTEYLTKASAKKAGWPRKQKQRSYEDSKSKSKYSYRTQGPEDRRNTSGYQRRCRDELGRWC